MFWSIPRSGSFWNNCCDTALCRGQNNSRTHQPPKGIFVDSDDPLTSWLTNDLPVDTEVNSKQIQDAGHSFQSCLLTNIEYRREVSVLWVTIAWLSATKGRLPKML